MQLPALAQLSLHCHRPEVCGAAVAAQWPQTGSQYFRKVPAHVYPKLAGDQLP
jgi:hypothetical protein